MRRSVLPDGSEAGETALAEQVGEFVLVEDAPIRGSEAERDAERGPPASWRSLRRFGRIGPALAGPERAEFDRVVRLELFRIAAATGRVPSEVEVAERLAEPREAVAHAIRRLADGKALILAPGGTSIWAANPFCAVPSGFRVRTQERTYWGICIWDALGIPASLSADATIETDCGDACGERLLLTIRDGSLADGEGVVHFGVPAARFWENIAFT